MSTPPLHARVTVQAYRTYTDGRPSEPIGEWVATSTTRTEQEIADWCTEHAKPGIGFRFLGQDGVIEPSVCKLPPAAY